MKKTLCIFLLTFISVASFGQVIPKGTRFIGGNFSIGYSQRAIKEGIANNTIQIGLSPSFAHFIKDNFAVAYSLGYNVASNGSRSYANGPLNRSGYHTVMAGLHFRNYKMISEKLGVSLQYGTNLGYHFVTAYNKSSDENSKSISLYFNAGPGIIYLLNEKFAIEGNASLVNFHLEYSWFAYTNNISLGTGLSANPGLGIGIRYFIK